MTIKYYVDSNGIYVGAFDDAININTSAWTEVPYPPANSTDVWTPPSYTPNLNVVKGEKILELWNRYLLEIQKSVSYTTEGGTTKIFQANFISQGNLKSTLAGCPIATPDGFYWVSEDDSRVMPFTRADVQNLASVIYIQGWLAFNNLQEKKDLVFLAETVSSVNAIVW